MSKNLDRYSKKWKEGCLIDTNNQGQISLIHIFRVFFLTFHFFIVGLPIATISVIIKIEIKRI
jgi:hypothetical protein